MNIEKEYYDNGNVAVEEHSKNGNFHRIDGPAVVWYYKNGNIEREEYFINGKHHRLNGPAYIRYNSNGSIDREVYYINGIIYKDMLQYLIMVEDYKKNMRRIYAGISKRILSKWKNTKRNIL